MKKKVIALVLEAIPVICAPVSYLLMISPYNSALIRDVIGVTTLLGFLGFVFFFIGRKLAKESKAVRVLGVFDWLATLFIVGIYVIAIFAFGL